MKKTYSGSCHCKAIQFGCDIDLAAGTRTCNCSFCAKAGFWKVFAMKGAFRLKRGEGALVDYQASPSEWPEGGVHHYFCGRCGMRPFSKGFLDMAPFNGEGHRAYSQGASVLQGGLKPAETEVRTARDSLSPVRVFDCVRNLMRCNGGLEPALQN